MNRDTELNSWATSALNFANEVRAKFGLKPAKRLARGDREKAASCPVTNTIRGRARYIQVNTGLESCGVKRIDEDTQRFDLPYPVIEFIVHFDDGAYPELIRR